MISGGTISVSLLSLGGRQSETGGEPGDGWFWVTGEEWSYLNWGEDQPDNGPGEYDYLGNRDSGPEWYDRINSPTTVHGYIVEYSESVIGRDEMSWCDVKDLFR